MAAILPFFFAKRIMIPFRFGVENSWSQEKWAQPESPSDPQRCSRKNFADVTQVTEFEKILSWIIKGPI